MGLSLKDQLLAAGLIKPDVAKSEAPQRVQKLAPKASSKAQADPAAKAKSSPPASQRPQSDLAALYQARDRQLATEKRLQVELAAQKAQAKAERKSKVQALIKDKAQNLPDAELARHFSYAKKIRRIYVSQEQRTALNSGLLGIVQFDGKFLLLDQAIVDAVFEAGPEFVALRGASIEPVVDLNSDYQDPKFQIPDDLVW